MVGADNLYICIPFIPFSDSNTSTDKYDSEMDSKMHNQHIKIMKK